MELLLLHDSVANMAMCRGAFEWRCQPSEHSEAWAHGEATNAVGAYASSAYASRSRCKQRVWLTCPRCGLFWNGALGAAWCCELPWCSSHVPQPSPPCTSSGCFGQMANPGSLCHGHDMLMPSAAVFEAALGTSFLRWTLSSV